MRDARAYFPFKLTLLSSFQLERAFRTTTGVFGAPQYASYTPRLLLALVLTLCAVGLFGSFAYYLLPAQRLSSESIVTTVWQKPSRQTKSSLFAKKRFIMIGDSTMERAANSLQSIAFHDCSLTKQASRCDFPKLYGLPYNQTALEVPVPPHVGPAVHGLKNRGCWDC